MTDKRVSIKITGQVQGVRYRAYIKVAAERTNVKGFVQNAPDGSVLVVAEGDEFDVLSFIQFIRSGSPSSVIDGFDAEWGETKNEFADFSIKP